MLLLLLLSSLTPSVPLLLLLLLLLEDLRYTLMTSAPPDYIEHTWTPPFYRRQPFLSHRPLSRIVEPGLYVHPSVLKSAALHKQHGVNSSLVVHVQRCPLVCAIKPSATDIRSLVSSGAIDSAAVDNNSAKKKEKKNENETRTEASFLVVPRVFVQTILPYVSHQTLFANDNRSVSLTVRPRHASHLGKTYRASTL